MNIRKFKLSYKIFSDLSLIGNASFEYSLAYLAKQPESNSILSFSFVDYQEDFQFFLHLYYLPGCVCSWIRFCLFLNSFLACSGVNSSK